LYLEMSSLDAPTLSSQNTDHARATKSLSKKCKSRYHPGAPPGCVNEDAVRTSFRPSCLRTSAFFQSQASPLLVGSFIFWMLLALSSTSNIQF